MAKDNNKTAAADNELDSKAESQTGAAASAVSNSVRADAASSAESPKTRKVKFAPEQKSPTLEIGNGQYVRSFNEKDQPFECATKEEFDFLLRTDHFVAVE
jgi:hypothetical protein